MNRNKVISLSDASECPDAVTAFYDRFRERITGIKTVQERSGILSDMEEHFREYVRQAPQSRNQLSEVYQSLKREAWERI